MKVRDPVTGKCIEDEIFIKNYINQNTDNSVKCIKNPDELDIDLILKKDDKVIGYIEVEGSWEKTWNNELRINWPSGLISVPLRRLKEFTIDNEELIENNIIEKPDFLRLGLDKKKFRPFPVKRFWTKVSFSGHSCIIADDIQILDRVNSNPRQNIVYNPLIKRDDKTTIIIGKFDEVTWGLENLIPFLEDKIKIKLHR